MMYKSLVCVMLPFCQLHCGGEGEQGPQGKQGDQGPKGEPGANGANGGGGGMAAADLCTEIKTVADKADADANKKDLAYAIAKAIIATNDNGVADYTEKDNLKQALSSLNTKTGPQGPAGPTGPQGNQGAAGNQGPAGASGGITNLGANAKNVADTSDATNTERVALAQAVAKSINSVATDNANYDTANGQTDLTAAIAAAIGLVAADSAHKITLGDAVADAIIDINTQGSSGSYSGHGQLVTALKALVELSTDAELATAILDAKAEPELQTAIADVITAIAGDAGKKAALATAIVTASSSDPFVQTTAMNTAIDAKITTAMDPAQLATAINAARAEANLQTAISTVITALSNDGAPGGGLNNLGDAIAKAITATADDTAAANYGERANLVDAIEKLGFTKSYYNEAGTYVAPQDLIIGTTTDEYCVVTGADKNTMTVVKHQELIKHAFCAYFTSGTSTSGDQTAQYDCAGGQDVSDGNTCT